MPAAVIAGTPVLATRHHLLAYTYLDARTTVLHSEDVDPIVAIGRLRSHGSTLTRSELQLLREANAASTSLKAFSWHRDHIEYDRARAEIFEKNVATMRKVVYGQLPDFSYL